MSTTKPAGRVGDSAKAPVDAHGCPTCPHSTTGPADKGSQDVLINNQFSVRVGDGGTHVACCGDNTWKAILGSATVLINNQCAHRQGDGTMHCGGGGELMMGSSNVLIGGKPSQTPAFDCAKAWAEIDQKVKDILSHTDPLKRNAFISAAYAELYKKDPSLMWAGLAAIVSRQAGCAMKAAQAHFWIPIAGNSARTAFGGLGFANKEIFRDIYPIMAFYSKNGWAGVSQCANFNGRKTHMSIQSALQDIHQGKWRTGSNTIAEYEQVTVVASKVYSNPRLQEVLQLNEDLIPGIEPPSVIPYFGSPYNPYGVPNMVDFAGVQKPEIAISAECGSKDIIPFEGSILNSRHRVNYYKKLMTIFIEYSKDFRFGLMDKIISQVLP